LNPPDDVCDTTVVFACSLLDDSTFVDKAAGEAGEEESETRPIFRRSSKDGSATRVVDAASSWTTTLPASSTS
jgi:hypothetical protein